ncbi:MAG: glycosyltransferase family 1 protein, partial [bacterium]
LQSAAKRAHKIITVSNHSKKDLITFCNIPENKIRVIYHGYKRFLVEENEHHISKDLNIQKPYILFVGERRPHKNMENLILAFSKLIKQNHNDIQLVIVGKKYADYSKPEKMISSLRLNKKVILTDAISDTGLAYLYKNTEMFVLPSFYEGFGMPILEAMSFGVPVLGSNTTSIPEVIGEAGILFNPHDPNEIAKNMEKVLKNRKIRNTLIEKGKKRVKEFSWDSAASQTLELYHLLAAHK